MRLIAEQYEKNWVKLVLAVAANVIFLVLLLKIFTPRYEINDDMFISMFIDGQLANKSNYNLCCNYFLSALLNLLYNLSSNRIPVYSYVLYFMMLVSFTGICYILLRRCKFLVALAESACLLGAFAANCYLGLTFTKTASVAITAGILLMLYSKDERVGKVEHWTGLSIGIILCLYSCTLRIHSFGIGLLLLFPLGMYELLLSIKNKERKVKAFFSYLMPFMVMMAVAAGFYFGNELMWQRSPYKEYKEFIESAREITDYHSSFNGYGLMPEVYDSLGIMPELCDMTKQYEGYDDTDVWTTEICRQVAKARDELGLYPKLPELLKTYLGCWKEIILYGFIWGPIGLALLWLLLSEKRKGQWFVLLAQLFIFSCLYMLFIWMDRYLVTRIDTGMFLAISASFLWMMKTESLGRWKTGLCLVITTLAVFICAYQNRLSSPWYPGNQVADYSYSKQQIQSLIDDEHLFLVGNKALNLYLYSPLEPMPAGYRDKLYFSGGWVVRHPQVVEVLADYGLENPYRDVINNDMVYVIPNDIEQTMKYINHYYNENARAELVQDLTSELGINIYRIVA